MPDPLPTPSPPTSTVAQIVQYVVNAITIIALAYIANQNHDNRDKIEQVEQRQETAADRADAVKTKLDEKIKEDTASTGVQLYSTWKYLEDVAYQSGSSKDKEKANEARKLYDEHLRKHNPKG